MSTSSNALPSIDQPLSAIDQRLSELLDQWHHAESQVTEWTLRERALRSEIFQLAFPTPRRGTNKRPLPYNMALVGQHKINLTVDQGACEATRSLISQPLFERVVQYTPKIVQGEYFKLLPNDLALFSQFVTEKPGLPTLNLKPADQVRW